MTMIEKDALFMSVTAQDSLLFNIPKKKRPKWLYSGYLLSGCKIWKCSEHTIPIWNIAGFEEHVRKHKKIEE